MNRDELDRRAEGELDAQEVATKATALDTTPSRDHLVNVAIALVEAVPGVGGLLASLLGSYIPRRREERMVEFARLLAATAERLGDRIDENAVLTDDFAGMVEDVLEEVTRRSSYGKRAYYAAAVANSLTPQAPGTRERERMMDALDDLRPSHISLLATLDATTDYAPGEPQTMSFVQRMDRLLPGIANEDVRMDWADLERLNILGGYPSGMMTTEGSRNPSARVTEFGHRFIMFITTL